MEPPAEERPAVASIAGGSLLVVDPVARTRETMAQIASCWGLAVRSARSGRQALSLLAEAADRGAPFEMVLVDRSLSGPSAEQIAAAVMADPRLRHAKLVLLVASGMRGDAARPRQPDSPPTCASRSMPTRCWNACARCAAGRRARSAGLITVHSISERRQPGLNLLLADDNPVNCRLASIILQRAGHTVDTVPDGLRAVEALRSHPYQLVLMDVQMPVMNGLEAAARIRSLPDRGKAAVPIVAITANAMRGDREACLAAGMNGYLTKPISAASLLDEIGRHAAT